MNSKSNQSYARYSSNTYVKKTCNNFYILDEIMSSFRHFGPLNVFWPQRPMSCFPAKGYAYLLFQVHMSVFSAGSKLCCHTFIFILLWLFQDASSVLRLIIACVKKNDNFYLHVSSQTMKYKIVQIRPWYLSDASFVLNTSRLFDPRKTIFVGGISGSLKAGNYAYYNCVCVHNSF